MPLRPPHHPLYPSARRIALFSLVIPAIYTIRNMSRTSPPPSSASQPLSSTTPPSPSPTATQTQFPTRPYKPRHPTFPYNPNDFLRLDESGDEDFYAQPRFVTHIDDHAIGLLMEYYERVLPRRGRVLDLCSSWVSHFPKELEEQAVRANKERGGKGKGEGLEVIGLGMNAAELKANPILKELILQDLNVDPTIPKQVAPLDATVSVVSIDYLTRPLEVLSTLKERTREGGRVHLVISNRCFPTKAVGRWLKVGEQERLEMVGDYLWHSGWRGIEIAEICDGRGSKEGWKRLLGTGVDPLWVVSGAKEREGLGDGGREE